MPLTTGPITPGQFYPPVAIYWPYPSPPVSPTNYYARTIPPPTALPPQQPQQQMVRDTHHKSYLLNKDVMSNLAKVYYFIVIDVCVKCAGSFKIDGILESINSVLILTK